MGAAGRGDGDVETRRRFAAPPKFRIFFSHAGEAFVAVVFVLGFGSRFLYFLFKSLLFFLLAFAYGNGDQEREGGG